MSLTPAALAASVSAPALLYTQARVHHDLELPAVEELEVECPLSGQFKTWVPDWSAIQIMAALNRAGIDLYEADNVRHTKFAKCRLKAGYLTVATTPPTNGSGKYRKPGNLKQGQENATLAQILMVILLRYRIDLDLHNEQVWLVTADKVGNRHVCVLVGKETVTVALHGDREIAQTDHGMAVYYPC